MTREKPGKGKDKSKGDLRDQAEAELEARGGTADASSAALDHQRLVHELRVHQVELELQNEELRSARKEIEAGLARYIELFEFAPIGYAVIARDGGIIKINHAGARVLGVERLQLAGATFGSLLLPTDRPLLEAMLEEAIGSEMKASAEVEAFAMRGTRLSLALTATVLRGPTPQILLAFEDVTERQTRARQLQSAEAALREANKRKDEFLAALSHELRNPLGPIRNGLFLLGQAGGNDEKAQRAQAIIERQVAHLTRLVDDLLDVTRVARGKIELKLRVLELGDLVRATVEDHRASFERNRVRLEARLETGPLWVKGDPARLVQAVSNILGNAQKFTPPGGTVAVSLQVAGASASAAEIRVRDTGVGITPRMLPNVFEPFTQAPQTMDRAAGGLGLGLAMVKGFIELHGGEVGIASEGVGKGTEVRIRLPLASAPEATEVAVVEDGPSRSRRVLLIEDNADAADSLSEALKVKGHEVRVARDGPTGLESARVFHPEVVICDIGLPRMDGYAVAKALRADDALKDVYLVALTGYAREEDIQRASDAGFNQHMTKPPVIDELNRVLDQG
jgi:two-component system CheB/CheR fusion protein